MLIRTGAEGFELEMGPWGVMGNRALSVEPYVPDFDAVAIPPYRLLKIHKCVFATGVGWWLGRHEH